MSSNLITKMQTGNANEIITSIIGTDFTQSQPSPDYTDAGYFSNSNGAFNVPLSGPTTGEIVEADLPLFKEMTIETWIKSDGWSWSNTTMTGSSGIHMVFGGNESLRTILHCSFDANTGIRFYFFPTTGGIPPVDVTNQSMSADTWTHMAMTMSDSAQQIKLYKNGIEIGSQTGTFTVTETSNTLHTSLGNRINSSDLRPFEGWFDGFTQYNYIKVASDFVDRNAKRSGLPDSKGD